jgi:uncharacterized delta-60 repeat protein
MMRKLLSSVLMLALLMSTFQIAFALQGSLDTGFNNTGATFGVYQDPLPDPPNPLPSGYVGFINSYYAGGDAYADGSVVVAGGYTSKDASSNFNKDFWVRRFLPNGTPDASFGAGGFVQTEFYRWGPNIVDRTDVSVTVVRIQPQDGKIVVAANCTNRGAASGAVILGGDLCLVRYNQNGTLDTSFGGNTVTARSGSSSTPYIFEPGKVFSFTGTNTQNTDTGRFNGTPTDLRIGADGRIYVFGNSQDLLAPPSGTTPVGRNTGFIAVYSANGTLQGINWYFDTTSNVNVGFGDTKIYGGAVQSDGNYIAAGYKQVRIGGNPNAALTAFKWTVFINGSNGSFLDNGNGNGLERATSVALLRSNKILISGSYPCTCPNGIGAALVRYNSDLSLDTSFGAGGILRYDNTYFEPNHVLLNASGDRITITGIQTDGKILAATTNGNIVRFNPNGLPDHSFGPGNPFPTIEDNYGYRSNLSFTSPFPVRSGDPRINFGYPFLKPNGRIVTAGQVATGDVIGMRGVATQLTSYPRNGGVFNDFDNDGKAELAVFSNGSWQWLRSFNNSLVTVQLGAAADKIAPADYDGDGRADPAIFQNGSWSIGQSSNTQTRIAQFGQAGDVPIPGDFNGDGLADFGVFRPSNATWYVLLSNPIQPGNITELQQQFGMQGDTPVLGDFDGEGKTDFAVFRNGNWSYLRSSDGQTVIVQLGQAGDIPVVGDYDGDGLADLAVFRPSSALWTIRRSSDGQTSQTQLGQAGDIPVPGDYDNDGKTDLAVYRGGIWTIQRSSNNQTSSSSFGQSNAQPIAAAYVPAHLQLSTSSYSVTEGSVATITVTRTGNTAIPLGIDYATADGTALQRTRYTTANGTLTFAAGDTSKTFSVLTTDNAYVDGNQTVNLTLSNPTGATLSTPATAVLTIIDNDTQPPTTNPLDDAQAFVRQQYDDFLNRAPDQGGLDYWTGQITQCGADQTCIRNKRIDVSNAFFYELEFQQTGSYVYRVYRAAYGNTQPFPNPDTSNDTERKKIPSFDVFASDRARVVGGASLAQGQSEFANIFVQRAEFLARYSANLDASSFIDTVLATIKNDSGPDLTPQKSALLSLFNQVGGGNAGRGAVLYRLADDNETTNPINNRAFIDAEYNRAFVATQYFGYLRRDADIGGFLFWLGQVNGAPLKDVLKQHAMVCSFITSTEYQQRFSSVVTHSNSECPH